MDRKGRPGPSRSRERWVALVVVCALLGAGCAGEALTPGTSSTTGTGVGTAAGASTIGAPGTTVTTAGATSTSTSTSTTAPAATTTTVPGWWRPVTPESPLRVWVLGDSLAETVGAAISRRAASVDSLVVLVDSAKGSGLVRSDPLNWPAGGAEGLVKRDPEVVVCLLGANDGQALPLPGEWLAFGTPAWDLEYARRVGAFMDLVLGGAARVYWVGVPIMAAAEYDERVQHLNALQRGEASARPGVAYVDAYTLFQDEEGRFAAELPDEQGNPVAVRLPDGVHFTTAGADRLARAVLRVIGVDWQVPELGG
jgi:hypothetical protein